MTTPTYICTFEEGDPGNKMLLGGKGANLCAMTQIGLNVPPGFIITTAACLAYLEANRLPDGLMAAVRTHIADLERKTGKRFGGTEHPLLVSVRSGSAMSMPGMMDTILNLGLNDETLQGLIRETANPRFAYDSYRRFIQLFGKIALGVPDEKFDRAMTEHQGAMRCRAGRRSVGGRAAGARGPLHRALQRAHGRAVSGRSAHAARALDRGGVPVVDGQARHRLPP